MKKHLRLVLRASEAGRRPFVITPPTTSIQKTHAPRCWVALLGTVLLLLLLTQGWLILHSAAPEKQADTPISPINPLIKLQASNFVDAGHLALLDTLWAALPFTRVIKHHQANSSSSSSRTSGGSFTSLTGTATPDFQQQQLSSQVSSVPDSLPDSNKPTQPRSTASSRSRSTDQSAATALPTLRAGSHPGSILLKRLAAFVLRSGLTGTQAREAYLASFQAVPSPRGFPAWPVKLPPTPEAAAAAEAAQQQQQHKGAHYISIDEGDSDTGYNVTAADFIKGRPRAPTLNDEAAVAAAAADATAFLARVTPASADGLQNQPDSNQQSQANELQLANMVLHGREAAQHLMTYALLLIKSSHRLAPCASDDASLPIDKLMGGPHAPRVVLAVTGTAAGAQALPNLVLQLLQFVLQSQPGSLYISLADRLGSSTGSSGDAGTSSSGETTAVWLDMLQLLMAPLQVPLLVVEDSNQQGPAHNPHGQNQQSISTAATRNAIVDPFFSKSGMDSCGLVSGLQEPIIGAGSSNSDQSTAGYTEGSVSSSRSESSGLSELQQHSGRAMLSRDPFISEVVSDAASTTTKERAAQSDAGAAQDPVAAAIAAATSSVSPPEADRTPQQDTPTHRPECFNPAWVVFIQGTSFFCKSDLQRLLMHTDADLTCGMDMHVAEPSPNPQAAGEADDGQAGPATPATPAAVVVESIRRQLQQQHQQQLRQEQEHTAAAPAAGQQAQQRKLLQQQQQQQQQEVPSAPLAAAGAAVWHERPPALDIWKHPVVYAGASVGRMVNGLPFNAAPYYAGGHAPTLRRLVAGLPTQVYCCWSGLSKLAAEPFKQGLRFREHAMQGECGATGHNLMCDDLHRTGFNKVLLDAGVLLTQDLDVSVKFTQLVKAADRAPFIRRSRWVEVQGSGAPWELDDHNLQQTYKQVQCCDAPDMMGMSANAAQSGNNSSSSSC